MKRRQWIAIGMTGILLGTSACAQSGSTAAESGAAQSSASETAEAAGTAATAETGAGSASVTDRVDTTGADGQTAALELADRSYELTLPAYNANYDYESWAQEEDTTYIAMDGSDVTIQGFGATYTEGTIEITRKGTYVLSGTLSDGQVHIDVEDKNVRLVLNGVTISNGDGPAIYAENAKNLYISLEAGTSNTLIDGSSYALADGEEEPDAALYTKCDLILNGTGTLTVRGNYSGGIRSKDDLVFREGTYEISAAGDAVKGKDGIYIYDGSYTVTAGGKGFVATNTEDAEKGSIYSEGGSFFVSSTDDAFHSNSDVMLLGGSYTIESGDDGIHADQVTLVYGSSVAVTKSYEGIEGAVVDLVDSAIEILASDDGVNAAGDLDEDGGEDTDDQRGWGGFMDGNEANVIYIDGGSVYVSADGDGIDSNGYIYIYDGEIVIDGPENDGNGYLDCGVAIVMDGGTLIGAGSSGMLETIAETSAVRSIVVGLGETVSGGTVELRDADGNTIVSYSPAKRYSSVTFAGYGFADGASYTAYADGTELGSVTIDGAVNTIGTIRTMGGGGFGGGMGAPGGGRGQGFDGERPDWGSFDGELPEGFDGERPDWGSFDGELPEGFDGERPDWGSFDGELPEGFDGERPDWGDFDGEAPEGGFDGGRGGFGGGRPEGEPPTR